jgi:hypothetical protein
MTRLETAGLAEYFLYPQINWNPKSDSIRRIAASLNIGTDALAFIDDQEFELAEVGHALPEVLRVRADQVAGAAGGRNSARGSSPANLGSGAGCTGRARRATTRSRHMSARARPSSPRWA